MERHTSKVGKRTSIRNSMADDSDEDDYALETMGITDGYRPSTHEDGTVSSQAPSTHERRVSNHPYRDLQTVPIPPPRPSSISKPRHDSFTLRHDGATSGAVVRNAAMASSSNTMPARSPSISSDVPLRVESPYQGPSGPSHPYQMYPQESRLARTASVATTSIVPVQERSYAGPSAPTFPYGMYPQNIVPEAEDDERAVTPVPVGFPGLNNNYQRRLGPDGEEIADIIGPDGHTEQLPPYSQYPDEAFARKIRPTVQVPVASGAGGIGLATRDPEFASQEDLNINTPDSRLSSRSLTLADSGSQIAAAAPISEKPPLTGWKAFAKRKVCGIVPAWALILVALVLIIFGIVLGSVFTALKAQHGEQQKDHHGENSSPQSAIYTTTMTTTFDASPLTTVPSGISALPTGVYSLPITNPSSSQNGCIQDSATSQAWSCQIQPALPYEIDVEFIQGASLLADNEMTMQYGNSTMDYLPYGAQPPLVSQFQVMGLVIDSQSPERGPAWFFQTTFDKMVVVPQDSLQASESSKRQYYPSSAFMGRKGTAQPGQSPWICYWNGTFLETFVYVNQTISSATQSSSSSSASATPTSTPSAYSDPDFRSIYPKVVKVQERRVPNGFQSIPPYCIQQSVDGVGNATPLLNSTGQPITIYLNETEPTTVSPVAISRRSNLFERLEERDTYLRERDPLSSCGCVWLST